jgi:hypothetical protein
MKIIATKHLDLFPIGDVSFTFKKNSRRKGKCIWIGEVDILHETELQITPAEEKALLKMSKSDLFTDGEKFYTTFGPRIMQIKHRQFQLELEMYNEQKKLEKSLVE